MSFLFFLVGGNDGVKSFAFTARKGRKRNDDKRDIIVFDLPLVRVCVRLSTLLRVFIRYASSPSSP
jgi:hypothetical protein